MFFILYKLYVLLPYTYPTPKLSPHRRLSLTFLLSPQKTHSVWFISILNYGDTENVLINHLLLVIPLSYLCHYTNLCPHKPHKHAHTHTQTHTHTHTQTHTYPTYIVISYVNNIYKLSFDEPLAHHLLLLVSWQIFTLELPGVPRVCMCKMCKKKVSHLFFWSGMPLSLFHGRLNVIPLI